MVMWLTKIAIFMVAPGQVSSVFGPFLEATAKRKLYTCNSPGNTGEVWDMLVWVLTAARGTFDLGSVDA